MNCKNCIHYDACKMLYDSLTYGYGDDDCTNYFDNYVVALEKCDNYTPKSEWVHLPVPIGGEMYVVLDDCTGKGTGKDFAEEVTIDKSGRIFYEGELWCRCSLFGKDVFKTRKEAEEELERRKEERND